MSCAVGRFSALLDGGTGFWASSVFAGALVLVASAVGVARSGKRGWAYGGLALVALWLALGRYGGFLPLVWKVAPLLSRLRFPEKYLAFFFMALAPLTALGVDRLRSSSGYAPPLLIGGAAMALAIGLPSLGVVEALWSRGGHGVAPGDPAPLIVEAAWSMGLLKSGGFLLAAAGALWGSTRYPGAALALPALIGVELWVGNGSQLPLVAPAAIEPNAFIERVRAWRRVRNRRTASHRSPIRPSAPR